MYINEGQKENYEVVMLEAINQTFTPEQIQVLIDSDIPLYGPNSIRKYIAEQSIYWFIKLYFYNEFTLPFANIHRDMIADLQEIYNRQVHLLPGIKIARAIPRNHAKSTFYSRILPLHGFLYAWSPLSVLLGNNEDAARRLVSNIKNAIESNEALQQDFPNIKGSFWGNERLQSNSGNIITAYGVGSGSIRGISQPRRPSLVILDDVDDDRSVRSEVELKNNIDWFDKAVMALGDNVRYTTSYIAVGTIIRKSSLLKHILDSADFDSCIESRIKAWSNHPELWDAWADEYKRLALEGNQPKDADSDTFYQQHKQQMLEGTAVLWPKKDEYYYAMVYKLARGNKAFNSEMMNQVDASDTILGAYQRIPVLPDDIQEYHLLGALDSTIKGGKNNDLSAWVEVYFHPVKKHMIVAHVDAKQRNYSATINDISRRILSNTQRYDGIFIETNSAGFIIANDIHKEIRAKGYNITGINNSLPKANRIEVLSQYMSNGQLVFLENIDSEMFTELDNYALGRDDSLDALSMIVLFLKDKGLLDIIEVRLPPTNIGVL